MILSRHFVNYCRFGKCDILHCKVGDINQLSEISLVVLYIYLFLLTYEAMLQIVNRAAKF